MPRTKTGLTPLGDFDVITGPPAPPLMQARPAAPVMPKAETRPDTAPPNSDQARSDR